jgi:DNA-binding transcriptional regulator YiaG
MSIYGKIGLRIKELREKTGMSQDTLARSMKLPRYR